VRTGAMLEEAVPKVAEHGIQVSFFQFLHRPARKIDNRELAAQKH